MSSVMSPASADEALKMLTAAMGYLAAADATAMTAEEQARCLRVLERANSVGTAARTSVLGAFGSGQGYSADADYSPRAWLIHKTGVTKGAAVAYTAWVRRAEDHPRVLARPEPGPRTPARPGTPGCPRPRPRLRLRNEPRRAHHLDGGRQAWRVTGGTLRYR
ncbi:MAG TPA: hypothetical protein VFW50_25000 [Streptosporangiaceae bacterium]|nr:hypothetical protein [Streptosporangiaceae bacterium]